MQNSSCQDLLYSTVNGKQFLLGCSLPVLWVILWIVFAGNFLGGEVVKKEVADVTET